MKAVTQSGLAISNVAQTTSFLQTAVIVGLEMLCADTAKMWQSPVVKVSCFMIQYILQVNLSNSNSGNDSLIIITWCFLTAASNTVSINVGSVVGAIVAATVFGFIVAIIACCVLCCCGNKEQ